ncbi:MAG: peptidase M64 [Bacteroidetes bacterium]|nr:MAG: peptidase M64 [Bacteroidota bacterium]PIE87827.1 MAG: peptidase M64 [Bacteroidota bacterium]
MATGFVSSAQFDTHFHPQSLRLDYVHAGNHSSHHYYFEGFRIEPHWGGNKNNLIDTLYYGKYFVKVFDKESEALLFSRGFSSLFGEWQTTVEAKETDRSFYESVVMPLPKKEAEVVLYCRSKQGHFMEVFRKTYHPNDYFVTTEMRKPYPVEAIHTGNEDPSKAVDIVILPDGYTKEEMEKFEKDCHRFKEALFSFEPYASCKKAFNIHAIMAPSLESGTDIPADSIYVNTLLGSSFYTFDSERYNMVMDHYTVRDLAANAPYDQIYILVNTTKYGGGAIYNFYSVSASSHPASQKVFIHEFGHAFAGLADEYYDSETSYNDFYTEGIEPWEPNITTLTNFEKKWKHQVKAGTPIPTPPTKEYLHTVGAFEGAGYVEKGIYRPMQDCMMNTFKGDLFCPVCVEAIHRVIDFHTK